jgi:hypothetical protein
LQGIVGRWNSSSNITLVFRAGFLIPFNSRITRTDELLSMLEDLVGKQFGGKMKVEDGLGGLYAKIAIRRLGRGRERNGFGNARALRNLFDKVIDRQSERLSEERRAGNRPDDFLLLKQDLIGPDPSSVVVNSKA